MSQEIFEIVQGMDAGSIETQLAIQCAPLIAGLKVSNLLIFPNAGLEEIEEILGHTGIFYYVLLAGEQKTTFFLYSKQGLEAYLSGTETAKLLQEMGYENLVLEDMLFTFRKRYRKYMADHQEFPHEMGLLLGYPAEDVEGFIRNNGRNFLYTGYWKVYGNLTEKVQLFGRFEQARERLIQLVSKGVSMAEIIDYYSEERLWNAAI